MARIEVSLHLKLPGDLELDRAHEIAEQVEAAIRERRARGAIRPDAPRAAQARRRPARRSTSTPQPSRRRCARRPAPSRASCASSAPTTASSPSSRSGSAAPDRSPTRTVARRAIEERVRERRPGDRRRRGTHRALMRLCMFHPVGHPLERGWVGRVDGDRVVQLAAQTLQSFFTGGGTAREHAEYPLAEVVLLAPVLHPPSIRIFDEQDAFVFANPAAVRGPGAEIPGTEGLALAPRVAAVIGAGGGLPRSRSSRSGAIRADDRRKTATSRSGSGRSPSPRRRSSPTPARSSSGSTAVERVRQLSPAFDWHAAVGLAADRTKLYAGRPRRRAELRLVEADRSRRHGGGRRRRDRRTRRRRRYGVATRSRRSRRGRAGSGSASGSTSTPILTAPR